VFVGSNIQQQHSIGKFKHIQGARIWGHLGSTSCQQVLHNGSYAARTQHGSKPEQELVLHNVAGDQPHVPHLPSGARAG
jgi:hypothetical protein